MQAPSRLAGQPGETYCVCGEPDDTDREFVECEQCSRWFHPECVGTTLQVLPCFAMQCCCAEGASHRLLHMC